MPKLLFSLILGYENFHSSIILKSSLAMGAKKFLQENYKIQFGKILMNDTTLKLYQIFQRFNFMWPNHYFYRVYCLQSKQALRAYNYIAQCFTIGREKMSTGCQEREDFLVGSGPHSSVQSFQSTSHLVKIMKTFLEHIATLFNDGYGGISSVRLTA